MALGSGFSYRDWAALSLDHSTLTLTTTNTELITLQNSLTPRLKQVSRLTSVDIGIVQEVYYTLTMTGAGSHNNIDGLEGMSIGCICLINHNIDFSKEIQVDVTLLDDVGVLIANEISNSESSSFIGANKFFIFSQVWTGVFEVRITFRILEPDPINVELGRLWIGNYLEADFDNGYGFHHGSGAKPAFSIGNDIHLRYKQPRKEMNFNFELVQNDVVYGSGIDSWYDFSQWASTNRDLIALPNVTTDAEMQYLGTYGVLKKPMLIERSKGSYWSANFDIVELV